MINTLAEGLVRFLNEKNIPSRPGVSYQSFDRIDSGARVDDDRSLLEIGETASATDRDSHV